MKKKILLFAFCSMLAVGSKAFAADFSVADSVPRAGETGVEKNQTIQVTFSENVGFQAEDVTINGDKNVISNVEVSGNSLTIQTKNQAAGTNYRIEAEGTVFLSYTTSCVEDPYYFSFSGQGMENFYNGRKLYAESVTVTEEGLRIKNGAAQKRAGRIYSAALPMNPEQVSAIEFDACAEQDTKLTLYYSSNSNNTGFSSDRKIDLEILAGAEKRTYSIPLAENAGWMGMSEVNQLMLEAESSGESTLTLSAVRILKNLEINQAEYLPGTFRLCKNYQTADEKDITDQSDLEDQTYAVLDAVKNNTKKDQTVALVAVVYRGGKIADVSCTQKIIPAGEELTGLSASVQTEPQDVVRAFLRRGVMDIRAIAPSIHVGR